MSSVNLIERTNHRPLAWILLVSILFFGILAVILALVTPASSSVALVQADLAKPAIAQSPHAPLQAGLELSLEGLDQIAVLAYDQSEWANSTIVYTIVVTNATSSVANNVCITYQWNATQPFGQWAMNPLPVITATTYQASPGLVDTFTQTIIPSDEEGHETGRAIWQLNPLSGGEVGMIYFQMTIPSNYRPMTAKRSREAIGPTQLGNSAEIVGDDNTGAPLPSTPVEYVFTLIQGPVIELIKTWEATPGVGPRPGWPITYTIQVHNMDESEGRADSIAASSIVIRDFFPVELAYDGYCTTQAPGGVCEVSGNTITWTLPSDFVLDIGETTYVTFTTRVLPTIEAGKSAKNDPEDLWVLAEQMPIPAPAPNKCNVSILSIFQKTVETPNPPANTNKYIRAFPNQEIVYTVWVFSPLSETDIISMTLYDYLPEDFFYIDMLSPDMPQPTGAPTETIQWDSLSLEANSIISFAFTVHVLPSASVQDGTSCNAEYLNKLLAWWSDMPPDADYSHEPEDAEVQLVPQIVLEKSFQPSGSKFPGELVTYTIMAENIGITAIPNIIITDALPSYFRYLHTIDHTEPFTIYNSSYLGFGAEMAWEIGTLAGGESFEFSFAAMVDGPSGQMSNFVSARSPETSMCKYWQEAKVKVLSPITIDKSVSPQFPSTVVQEETFTYTIDIRNISPLVPYTLTHLFDYMDHLGLEGTTWPDQEGKIYVYSTTHLLAPGSLPWTHYFAPTLTGDATGSEWCQNMDEITYRQPWQEAAGLRTDGKVQVRVLDPNGLSWVAQNGTDLAQTNLLPHISLEQYLYPHKVSMGHVVTVTLVLTNNMRNGSGGQAMPVDNIRLNYAMPEGFTYEGEVGDTRPPDEIGDSLVWNGVHLDQGPYTTETFVFQIRAPYDEKNIDSIATANPLDNPELCIPPAGEPLPDELATVKGIEVDKEPDKQMVGPREGIIYEMELENKTALPLNNVYITDTLPPGFMFDLMLAGSPEPISVDEQNVVWELDFDPYRGDQDEHVLKFKVLAAEQVGDYINTVTGTHPSAYVIYKDCEHDDEPRECSKYAIDGLIHVGAGVGLYKTVAPTQVVAGGEVVYTLVFHNLLFEQTIHGIVVTDTLPPGFSYMEMLEGPEPDSTDPLRWEVNSLGPGAKKNFIFRAHTDLGLLETTYYNRATASALDPNNDPITIPPTDDTAPVRVTSGILPPTIEKSVSPSFVQAGETVTYTITLQNHTSEPQTIQLTDTLPAPLGFVSVVGDTPQPSSISPLAWNAVTIEGQSTRTLVFRALVDPYTSAGVYWNHLDAKMGVFYLPSLDAAMLEVEGQIIYDLQVSKSDGVILAFEGETLVYNIYYTFTHPIVEDHFDLLNVVLTETIEPADYVSVVEQEDGWQRVHGSNVYTYNVGDLGYHASGIRTGEISFTVTLSDSIPEEHKRLTNTVQIDHQIAIDALEATTANNTYQDIDILRGVDLVVTDISFTPDPPRVGQVNTATVTFVNQGKDDLLTRWNGSGASDDWLFALEFYLKDSDNTPDDVFDHEDGYCGNRACTVVRDEYVGWWPGMSDGETQQWHFNFTADQEDTLFAYAQIDVSWPEGEGPRPGGDIGWGQTFGLIDEAIEDNNIFRYGVIEVKEPCTPLTSVDFAWSPANPTTGEHVQLTASTVPLNASEPITFEWDMGDGRTEAGNPTYHTFINSGAFNVRATAANDCSSVQMNHNINVTGDPIDPEYGVLLVPETSTEEGPPDATVQHIMTVHNQSTNMADTFDVGLDGELNPPDWAFSVWPESLNLLPGGAGQVVVTVWIPADANLEDYDDLYLVAQSRGNPDLYDRSRLRTRVYAVPPPQNPIYLPLVIKND